MIKRRIWAISAASRKRACLETREGLRKLMAGKTSFSIAHRLATIRDSAKIMITTGGIVEYAPHDELMARQGFYYALYMSQFKGKAPVGAKAADVDFQYLSRSELCWT